MKAHQWITIRGRVTWPVCAHCGLVRLRNTATERAARAACEGESE